MGKITDQDRKIPAPTAHTTSAVLFLVFNRPDTTFQVFEKIRAARPPRLYIAADGPRAEKHGEAESCRLTRACAAAVDWPCQLITLFREQNLGCKEAVSSAIDWFFSHEEEGIILEDDCLPAPEFFSFCDSLLEHYRHDTRVRHICGCNFQFSHRRGDASYYFSHLTHIWGWASWRRAWKDYDKNLSAYTLEEISHGIADIFDEPIIVERWNHIAGELRANRINTWDYQLAITNLLQNALCVIPNENLITNIGFGANATHTTDHGMRYANIPHGQLGDITHPTFFTPNKPADLFTLSEEFNVEAIRVRRKQQNSPLRRLRHRIKRWLGRHGGPRRWQDAGRTH